MRTNVTKQFRSGNETPTLSFPGTNVHSLCGHFVPGNGSAWKRNVPLPLAEPVHYTLYIKYLTNVVFVYFWNDENKFLKCFVVVVYSVPGLIRITVSIATLLSASYLHRRRFLTLQTVF